jgi:hypothetical protein
MALDKFIASSPAWHSYSLTTRVQALIVKEESSLYYMSPPYSSLRIHQRGHVTASYVSKFSCCLSVAVKLGFFGYSLRLLLLQEKIVSKDFGVQSQQKIGMGIIPR